MSNTIDSIATDITWIKKEISNIKRKVENELPHQIESLEDNFQSYKDTTSRWLIGIFVSLIFLLVSVILGLVR